MTFGTAAFTESHRTELIRAQFKKIQMLAATYGMPLADDASDADMQYVLAKAKNTQMSKPCFVREQDAERFETATALVMAITKYLRPSARP